MYFVKGSLKKYSKSKHSGKALAKVIRDTAFTVDSAALTSTVDGSVLLTTKIKKKKSYI